MTSNNEYILYQATIYKKYFILYNKNTNFVFQILSTFLLNHNVLFYLQALRL